MRDRKGVTMRQLFFRQQEKRLAGDPVPADFGENVFLWG
jgi:hypothetical protein